MEICMVLANSDFPPDIRVEKEARSLLSAGHRVVLLCLRTGDNPAVSDWNGMEVRRIAPLPLLVRKLNSLVYALFLRDVQWKRAIRKLTNRRAIDVIHVHDLPMVGTALAAARKGKVPVIADLHENFPALVRLAFARRKPNLPQRLMWPSRWERVERRWANRCGHVLVVVDEAKERLIAKEIPPEKVTVVENTVDVEYFLSLPIHDALVEQFKGDFVICYVGGFSPHRGLDTAIKAMPRILKQMPNAKLLLVGDGGMMPQLRSLVDEMGLATRVVFTGWQDFLRVPSYIAGSDVCIIPHTSTEQTEATVPHKLYQYMLMGKPLVVSSCRPLRRLIQETGGGLAFKAGDSDSFAGAISRLEDPTLRRKMGEAGRTAVLEKHNWEATSEKLLEVYTRVIERSG